MPTLTKCGIYISCWKNDRKYDRIFEDYRVYNKAYHQYYINMWIMVVIYVEVKL